MEKHVLRYKGTDQWTGSISQARKPRACCVPHGPCSEMPAPSLMFSHTIPVALTFSTVFIPRPLTLLLCLSDLYYWKFIIYSDKLIWKLYWSFRTEKVMWFKTDKACWRRQKTELIFETRPLGRRCLKRRGWKHVLWEKVMNSKLQPQWRCPSHLRLSSELPSCSKICPQPSYPPHIPSWPCHTWSVRS